MARCPLNPNGRLNAEVIRPVANGLDVTRHLRDMWIIDFGVAMPVHEAVLFEGPFEYAAEHVQPERATNRAPKLARKWWFHERPRPEMRAAIAPLRRYIATPGVARHRLFV